MSAVPKLRFPEFDEEWRLQKLKENILLISGQHLSPEEYSDRGEVPYFTGPTDFTDDTSKVKKWTATHRSVARSGSILINVKGSGVGEMAQTKLENVVIGRQLMSIEGKNASTGFLYQNLLKKRQLMKALASGNMIPGLSRADLFSLSVSIPSLPEQQKIASFLSAIDKKIDLLRQKKDALELYKKGLMQKIFSQEIRFKQDDGSDFPEWEEVALGDVFAERSERGRGDKQLLGVTLSKGVVRASEIEKIDRSSSDLSNYKYVKVGDIAYNSMRMWQGASGASNYNGIVSPAYTVITPLGDNEAKFWGYLFKYPEMIKVFERHSQGLTSDTWNLKFKALSTIKVLRPSGKEQKKISAFFNSIDAKMEKLSSKIEQMETFKKGLLQQMFV